MRAVQTWKNWGDDVAVNESGHPCTTGKDRTGWAAAATLLLLGVSQEDVLYDYELTNRDLLPAMKRLFEHFRAAGGNPHPLEPVLASIPTTSAPPLMR